MAWSNIGREGVWALLIIFCLLQRSVVSMHQSSSVPDSRKPAPDKLKREMPCLEVARNREPMVALKEDSKEVLNNPVSWEEGRESVLVKIAWIVRIGVQETG